MGKSMSPAGPSVVQEMEATIVRLQERVEQLKIDAERYRFLRDSENWGEDSGYDSWESLAQSTMCDFDEIVDARQAAALLDRSKE